jgi:hypothetical protein
VHLDPEQVLLALYTDGFDTRDLQQVLRTS